MARSTWALLALVAILGCNDSTPNQKQPDAEKRGKAAAGPFASDHDAMMRDVRESLLRDKDVTPRTLPNGQIMAELPGDSSVVLARRNADGTIERVCVDNPEDAEEFLLAAPRAGE